MITLPTIAFTLCDESVLILLHGRDAPSDEDWEQWVDAIRGLLPSRHNVRGLVVTPHGTGPNARQRKAVTDALFGRPQLVAVMSDHRATRVLVTAFSWFNADLRGLRRDDYAGAVEHLRLSPEWEERLPREVGELQRRLALGKISAG